MIASIFKSWSSTKLTWLGKITVLKSIALSKINYTVACLDTPGSFAHKVKELNESFLWEGNPIFSLSALTPPPQTYFSPSPFLKI